MPDVEIQGTNTTLSFPDTMTPDQIKTVLASHPMVKQLRQQALSASARPRRVPAGNGDPLGDPSVVPQTLAPTSAPFETQPVARALHQSRLNLDLQRMLDEQGITLPQAKTQGISPAIQQAQQRQDAGTVADARRADALYRRTTSPEVPQDYDPIPVGTHLKPLDPSLNRVASSLLTGKNPIVANPSFIGGSLLDKYVGQEGTGDQLAQMKGFAPKLTQGVTGFLEPDTLATMAATAPLSLVPGGNLALLSLFGADAARGAIEEAQQGDYGGALGSLTAFGLPFLAHGVHTRLNETPEAAQARQSRRQRKGTPQPAAEVVPPIEPSIVPTPLEMPQETPQPMTLTPTPEPAIVPLVEPPAVADSLPTPTPTPEPAGLTAARNEVTEAERTARGLSPVEKQQYTNVGDAYLQGKAAVENGEIEPRSLAQSVAENARPLSATEIGALSHDRARLTQDHSSLTKQIADAVDRGAKPEEVSALQAQRDAVESAFDVNDQALVKGGREQSAAFNARKLTIAEDFSPLGVKQRAKAAKGAELQPKEEARLNKLTNDLADVETQLQTAPEKTVRQETNRGTQGLIKLSDTEAARAAEIKKRIFAKFSQVGAVPDVSVIGDIAELGGLYFKAGLRTFAAWRAQMKEDVPDAAESHLQRAWAQIRTEAQDAKTGTAPPRSTTFVEAMAQKLGWEKAHGFVSTLDDAGLLQKLLDGQEMSAAEQKQVKDAWSAHAPAQRGRTAPVAGQAELSAILRAAKDTTRRTMTDAQRLKAQITTAQNRIAELSQAVAEGTRPRRRTTAGGVTSPELETLRAKVKELQAQLPAAEKAAATPESLEPSRTRRLNTQITDLQRRLTEGDFSFPKRDKVPSTPSVAELELKRDALKHEIEKSIRRLKPMTPYDMAARWQRFALLSGVSTLGKLAAAASGRMVTTPLEEGVGAVLSALPGLKSIAARAPREGGANLAAEQKAITAFFKSVVEGDPGTLADMRSKLTTGENSLDVKFGDDEHDHHPVWDFFGGLHGALKTPAQRAEFYRSLEKRTAHAQNTGHDVSDPAVQARLGAEAYADSKRAILMGENKLVDAYNRGMEGVKSVSPGAAFVMKTLLPIVRIPANYVKEGLLYGAGTVPASAELLRSNITAEGVGKGLQTTLSRDMGKNLNPEQADFILRAMKKNGVGAGLLLLGYFGSDALHAGGYYDPKDKREDGSKPGELIALGHHVPHWAAHTPVLECLQMGATLRRLQARNADAGETAFTVGRGIAEQVPFLDMPVELGKALRDDASFGKFSGSYVRSLLEPVALQQIAGWTDYTRMDETGEHEKRKPQGFGDSLKMGVPGLRQQVPTASEVKESAAEKRTGAVRRRPNTSPPTPTTQRGRDTRRTRR